MAKHPKDRFRLTKFVLAATGGKAFEGYKDLSTDEYERSVYPLFPLPVLKQIIAVVQEWEGDTELLAYDAQKDEVVIDLGMGGDKNDPFEKSIYHFDPIEIEGIGKLYPVGWDADEWSEAPGKWLQ